MNRKQWKKLTPDEQRIHIAELCGWEKGPKNSISLGAFGHMTPMTCWHLKGIKGDWQDSPPNYLNDLNAMHKAEQNSHIFKSWRGKKCWMENMHICCDLGRQPESEPDRIHALIATASQRAEAFVVTLDGI